LGAASLWTACQASPSPPTKVVVLDSGADAAPSRLLRWVDRTGKTIEDGGAAGPYENVSLAPSGNRIAETRLQGEAGDIWLSDLKPGSGARFTLDSAMEDNAVWSPDERRIVFASGRGGDVRNLYVKNVDGWGTEELLLCSNASKYPTDWSRDGRFLLYTEIGTLSDLWVLPMTGARTPERFLTTRFSENRARFSRDGKWVAYTSNEAGAEEVFVQSFPYGKGKWRVSWRGGVEPHWRADGRELFYIRTGEVWAVDVEHTRTGELTFGYPHKLFDAPGLVTANLATRLNVSPDGQRFLLTLTN
jgi:Tol biopolymer transport system component